MSISRRHGTVIARALALGLLTAIPAGATGGNAERRVQLNAAKVIQLEPATQSFEVVRKNNKTVFTVFYSDGTDFYGTPLTNFKVGTVLTIVGELSGKQLVAEEISTKSASLSFGSSGPFTGVKWVGNV
jgi:hypothetical protein